MRIAFILASLALLAGRVVRRRQLVPERMWRREQHRGNSERKLDADIVPNAVQRVRHCRAQRNERAPHEERSDVTRS